MYVRLPDDGIDPKTLKDLWILKLLTVKLESMIYAGRFICHCQKAMIVTRYIISDHLRSLRVILKSRPKHVHSI